MTADHSVTQKTDIPLILHFRIDINRLEKDGKRYPWPRLSICPRCKGVRIWGHGYVARCFDGWDERLWLKRYRCVDCRAVHTARPESHWPRFLATWKLILISLARKLKKDRWLKGLSRQRQQYWWKGFKKQAGRDGLECSLNVLARMARKPIIPATHSLKYYELCPDRYTPHLTFAATAAGGSG